MVKHRAALVLAVTALAAGCAAQPAQVVSGAETFVTHCAACHGQRGEGDGPVASTLSVPVPNLRTLAQRNGSFPAEWVASKIDGRNLPAAHGVTAMPVWGGVFDTTGQLFVDAESSKQRIDDVVEFLMGLQVASK